MGRFETYYKPVLDKLEEWGIEFGIQCLGDACPNWCEDKGRPGANVYPRTQGHIHGKHWLATFTRKGAPKGSSGEIFGMEFWSCLADENRNAALMGLGETGFRYGTSKKVAPEEDTRTGKVGRFKKQPQPYDVLSVCEWYPPSTVFEDWCVDMDYDPDSRRDHAAWEACMAQWAKVERFFKYDEVVWLRENCR